MQKSLKKSSLQNVLLDKDEEDQEGLGMTVLVSKVSLNIDQTFFHCCFGPGWQNLAAFHREQNGNENFRQARIYNFRVKCVVFARNRKFAKLTQ